MSAESRPIADDEPTLPSLPPGDLDDRPTWTGFDVQALMHGPTPASLPPNAGEDDRQWAWMRLLGRAQAATARDVQRLRYRVRRLEKSVRLSGTIIAVVTALAEIARVVLQ